MNNIAVIGYRGNLSKNLLELMYLRGFSKDNIAVYDTAAGFETKIPFGEEDIPLRPFSEFKSDNLSSIIYLSGDIKSQKQILSLKNQNIWLINADEGFASLATAPMIVGGINEDCAVSSSKVINVPNPQVAMLLGAIANIHNKYGIKTIRLSTYVAADFEGQDGMSELYNQTRRILMNDVASSTGSLFHKTVAFNVIPQVGEFIGEETITEWQYNTQIKQILGGNTKIHANCAIVPAFVGVGQYANIETISEIDVDEAKKDIQKTRGVLLVDRQEDGGYAALNDVQGENSIFVSRLRQDTTSDNAISLWIAGDTYKIAAQNILSILKQLLKKDK